MYEQDHVDDPGRECYQESEEGSDGHENGGGTGSGELGRREEEEARGRERVRREWLAKRRDSKGISRLTTPRRPKIIARPARPLKEKKNQDER